MPNRKPSLPSAPTETGDPEGTLSVTQILSEDRLLRQRNSRQKIVERRRVVQKMQQALANDGLELYFQPIISLSTGLAYGAEAQVRLRHSRRGAILIGQFMPLLERSDVIIEIGQWAIKHLCEHAINFSKDFVFFLPVSTRYLRSGNLMTDIILALHKTGLPPAQLALQMEIDVLLSDNEDVLFALRAAKGLGVKLVLDQFGESYASLAPIENLSFSILRMGRSLTQNLLQGSEAPPLTHAAIKAGHMLGCIVLADGIENEVQSELLGEAKIDLGQGGYFSQAVSATALSQMFALDENQPR